MTNISPTQDSINDLENSILNSSKDYVINLFNQVHDARLVYHNFQRTSEIVKMVENIGEAENFSADTIEIATIAAWFQDVGLLFDYENHEQKSANISKEFLEVQQYDKTKITQVLDCIASTKDDAVPGNREAQLLVDGIHAFEATSNFFYTRPLLRVEWELMANRQLDDVEWNQLQLQYLLGAKFYTAYGKNNFSPEVAQNILTQKQKTAKSQKSMISKQIMEGDVRKFQHLERKAPERLTQTFFRVNYRNHINLSAIADNKANIMISVNAILISVMISYLSSQNIAQTNPMVLLPVVIFIVTGLASLIFAVLSIRPKITSLNPSDTSVEEAKKNIIYFGNFVTLSIDQFEEAMDAMFRDSELMYGNMTRDLYYLGQVLDKKYRYLTMAYNIFMVGFVATVITFLVFTFM